MNSKEKWEINTYEAKQFLNYKASIDPNLIRSTKKYFNRKKSKQASKQSNSPERLILKTDVEFTTTLDFIAKIWESIDHQLHFSTRTYGIVNDVVADFHYKSNKVLICSNERFIYNFSKIKNKFKMLNQMPKSV